MIDTTFFQTSREDARLAFTEKRSVRASQDAEKLPGVLRVAWMCWLFISVVVIAWTSPFGTVASIVPPAIGLPLMSTGMATAVNVSPGRMVEGAQAEVVLAPAFELHVVADQIEDIGGVANALDGILWYACHVNSGPNSKGDR